jgi:MoxR-like ATPase
MSSDRSQGPEADLKALWDSYDALRNQLGRVVVGQETAMRQLMTGLLCGGHMVMIGVPGLAKTLMVRALAQALGWSFHRIQFTPDLMPADITGTEILQSDESGQRRELVFHKGPIFANLVLADEINRTPPKTQAALLEAMQEQAVTVNGTTYALNAPFVVIATQNPIEQEGTYPLPEAQLDRFMLSIHMDYPGGQHEREIASRSPRMQLPKMEPVASPDQFHRFVELIDAVPVSDHVLDYAVSLVMASRPTDPSADAYVRKYISWGVGPRGAQHLVTAAKAAALLDRRPSPEVRDIREMALPVLRHRLIPNYNAMGEGLDAKDVIEHLLQNVGEPVGAA